MANKIRLAGTTSNTFEIGLQGATFSSANVVSPYTLTLPADTGSNGQVLTTNGSGNLSWSSAGSSNSIQNGTSNVSINTSNGNITFGANGIANVVVVDTNGSLNAQNGSNPQIVIQGLDNANGGVSPTVVFNASAGNLTNPEPLTTPYNSRLFELTGKGYNGGSYAFGGSMAMRNQGYPSSPTWYCYGEPLYQYVQQLGSDDVFFFENHSGGQLFTGGYNITGGFVPQQLNYNINLDNYDGNFTTFTMAYNGNFTIPGIYNGNGGGLSSLNGSNVTGQVPYAAVANSVAVANVSGIGNIATINLTGSTSNVLYGNGVFAPISVTSVANANYANFAGTVLTNAQPNITSVGTLTSLAVTGNITSGNATLGNLTTSNFFSGNGSLLSSITAANVSGNVATATLAYTSNLTSNNSSNTFYMVFASGNGAQQLSIDNTGSVITYNPFQGNLTVNNVIGNVTGTAGSATTAGTVTTAAQPNITSVGTLTSLAVTGNVSAGNVNAPTFGAHNGTIGATTPNTASFTTVSASGQITSTLATGNAPFVVTSTTQVANLNVATAGTATTAGTVTTAAQPNITSVGTLTSLAVTGNITSGNANVTGQLISTVATGTAPLVVTSTTQVANLSVATAGLATYATTANSVAVANVSGIGNIATVNLNGNSSQVLYGNGTFAAAGSSTKQYLFAYNAGTTVSMSAANTNLKMDTVGSNTASVTYDTATGNLLLPTNKNMRISVTGMSYIIGSTSTDRNTDIMWVYSANNANVTSGVFMTMKAVDISSGTATTYNGGGGFDLVVNMSSSANIKLVSRSAVSSTTWTTGQIVVTEL